jgi:hypothetical protein
MSIARTPERLQLPESLRDQLLEFRRRVWSIKTAEAVSAAAFGVVVAFLLMFAVDRVWDTPGWLRTTLFVAAAIGLATVPFRLHRWVWRNRRLEQLARLLARKHPRIGDQLLGVIELAGNDAEQARSRALCEAAIHQVAEDAKQRDFRDAVPRPRHRQWATTLAVPAAIAVGLFAFVPAAASNAMARFLMPWRDTPRYTFADLERLPERLVVAHGEPFTLAARLSEKTAWKPARGTARLGDMPAVAAMLRDGRYEFALPSQIDAGHLFVHIGDAMQTIRVEPKLRPELASIVADVTLPDYLGRPEPQRKDVRGGAITLVKGSKAAFAATATRDLASAQVDGRPATPSGASVTSPIVAVDGTRTVEFRWQDAFGLAGKEPFNLSVAARDDEAPSLSCEGLPRQKVVLDIEQLAFKVHALDDFGVKRVGIEWRGVVDPVVKSPAEGERILAAGGPDKEAFDVAGTFTAKSLGIEPQAVNVRVFVEDYLPGRPRVYSPPYTLFVLNAEQHAIWLTEQLSKWHRQSLEVRDREMGLFETNKALRALPPEDLDKPETRRRIENQAAAEMANGRRLSNLVVSGEDLIKQAMRNPEFGVGHLEKWAEMLQILKDISANRMPSVADLLKQAAQAPKLAAGPVGPKTPMAGMIRSSAPAAPGNAPAKPGQPIPRVVDQESSQNSPNEKEAKAGKPSGPKPPAPLRLPVTTLAGKPSDTPPPETPEQQAMEEAVRKQQDLLAEFEKIAEELNKVLANLEGSTLVKRLKAASRLQYKIGGRIGDQVGGAFGVAAPSTPGESAKVFGEMAEQESKGSLDVSTIMDDMSAYYERRHYVRFKTVLDEMKKEDVIGGLRQVGDDIKKEPGVSIAQCEFWSDTLDRWAEDLVDPANCGACPGAKSRDSLPPSIVLEVLQILEGEVNLREDTRVAQQARPALEAKEYARRANGLANTQGGLRDRTDKVRDRIRDLPDGDQQFGYEINLLGKVSDVMLEASTILDGPETGPPAIAAETEAIELLLQSRRINPKGGGGGGSTPGGGGRGETKDSALALIGKGLNQREVREDRGVSQATGDSGPVLPEEFRAGLDEYFNRLDRPGGQ